LGVVNSITVPQYLIKTVNSTLSDKNISLSCFIDFPLGISDLKTRLYSIEQASKNGVSSIDIVMPQNLAANRKYDKIREEVKNFCDLASLLNIEIRYILEYRIFDHSCLKKICEIFDNNNIKYVYPSTGFFIDNLADNILASLFLYQNSKNINILATGNIWLDKHFDTIRKSGLFGFRTSSLHSIKNYVSFNLSNPIK
jgi:deoxyribose-phosphate aldolase